MQTNFLDRHSCRIAEADIHNHRNHNSYSFTSIKLVTFILYENKVKVTGRIYYFSKSKVHVERGMLGMLRQDGRGLPYIISNYSSVLTLLISLIDHSRIRL